jgi:pimeloyl-ACP methyl ester carboxylesterase
VSQVREYTVEVAGEHCRIQEKGDGERIGFLPGLWGMPNWLPFLDELAEHHTVVALSLPGFHGGGPTGFRALDGHLDWLSATLDLIEQADLVGAPLIGCSVAGMLAADVAATSPATVGTLVLLGSWGLFDVDDPGLNFFAQLEPEFPLSLAVDQDRLTAAMAPPEGVDPVEWTIAQVRCNEAAARISWPFGDRGLAKRLRRIRRPTLILWGEQDRIRPPSYAERFAEGISGPTRTDLVAGAGHLCHIDQPEAAAKYVLSFLATHS